LAWAHHPGGSAIWRYRRLDLFAATVAGWGLGLGAGWPGQAPRSSAPLQTVGLLYLEVARPGLGRRTVADRPRREFDAGETPLSFVLCECLPFVLVVRRQWHDCVAARQLVEHLGEAAIGVALPLVPAEEPLDLLFGIDAVQVDQGLSLGRVEQA